MKKSGAAFWAIAGLAAGGLSAFSVFGISWWMALLAALVFLLWWSLYYYKLKYTRKNRMLYIESGIVFRKTRAVPEDNILWVTLLRPRCGRFCAASLLHTAGGMVVIFAEYSTKG